MNTRLLRKIKKAILAEPLRLDMQHWFNTKDKIAPCGSTACIAGWAVALDYQSKERVKWATAVHDKSGLSAEYRAATLLGLRRDETDALFHVDDWPREFAAEYNNAARDLDGLDRQLLGYHDTRKTRKLRRQMARVTADRIEHFIKTNGEE